MGAALTAYYNENNPDAAQWLRDLIRGGHLPPGDVDERSIEDVHPNDLRDYIQCHFFAGIGIWPYALRAAGWADDRPVWTGSCPCQPFSQAGEGAGFDDQRHLWPHWHHLIKERRPPVIFGEQVASKDADPWIDLVHADVEAMGYAFGCVPFPSAGIGAPHIRDRCYWVAYANGRAGRKGRAHLRGRPDGGHAESRTGSGGRVLPSGMANADDARLERRRGVPERADQCTAGPDGMALGLADTGRTRSFPSAQRGIHSGQESSGAWNEQLERRGSAIERPGPTNSIWSAADWLLCRDGKWRPVEPGTFPLAHGLPRSMGSLPPELRRLAEVAGLDGKSLSGAKSFRVSGLRGYGNAINAEAARVFIECYLERLS